MLDKETTKYFYDATWLIQNDVGNQRDKLLKYYRLYKELLNKILENESRVFSSYFAKTVFVIDHFQIPEEITAYLKKFTLYAKSASKNKNYEVRNYFPNYGLISIAKLIEYFSEIDIPLELKSTISTFEDKEKKFAYKQPMTELIEEIRCVILDKSPTKNGIYELICVSDDFGTFKVQLRSPWTELYHIAWKNAVINFINLRYKDKLNNILTTIHNTFAVLEPDYLLDATDIAECFQNSGANPNLYFIKKFCNSSVNESMIAGNLINTCLDELLVNPDADFEDIYNNALMNKPLQIFSLALKDKTVVQRIRDKVNEQFYNLKEIIKEKIKFEIVTVEPSFISPKYGLQGRLDVLLEYFDDNFKKEIIELKSSRGPDNSTLIKTYDGKTLSSKVWNNNLAQITVYNLMLDSTFPGRHGTSSVLYSAALKESIRNAENIHQKKQEILLVRNKIISIEKALMEKDYSILKRFTPDDFGERPSYNNDDIIKFSNYYHSPDTVVKEYFHYFLSFILNEMSSSKVGGNNDSKGFSSLWLESADEKEEDFSMLRNLKLNIEESDFDNMYLLLESRETELQLSSFRKGDMIILYPENDDGITNVWNNQLLKSTIKEISERTIKISLRNKLFDKRIFNSDKLWIIEPDYIDSTNKKLYNSIFNFLSAENQKQKLILGLQKPEFNLSIKIDDKKLNPNQRDIVQNAIASQDYYLIQGPPGTGKTSFVLKSIVGNIHKSSNENLLVMAYTNRAVDEICSALKTIGDDFQFLRTGSKESSEHHDVLISSLSGKIGIRELYIKIRNCRVFVSTVSSVISNPEIMELKKFDTAIIDEASQILEPQIVGILTNVKRFILIGDEKQLPAVVTQEDIKLNVESELLHGINLKNLGISLFERLLIGCKKNIWSDAYGMLKQQARMHEKIQEFPNKYFYEGQLQIFANNDWQLTGQSIFSNLSENVIFSTLSKNRIVFIESDKESGRKINHSEIKIAVDLTKEIRNIYAEKFNETTLGIICPFRAQCAEIYRQMDKDLRKLVMVDTVERFQGSERDIIIISFAVNSEYQLKTMQSLTDIGGILVDRKLNVAMTRAKEYLVFLGNSEILSRSQLYNQLLEFLKEKNSLINL